MKHLTRRLIVLLLLSSAGLLDRAADLTLPLKPKSVRLAVIGDSGTGEKPQFDVAQQMTAFHAAFPFEFVVMLGDNIYGHHEPSDFKRKFEDPYAPLLDAGVKFFASPTCHHRPEVYGGLAEAEASTLLKSFFQERR